jgi:5-methylcytosine-specific restriction enzyme subunit McrC
LGEAPNTQPERLEIETLETISLVEETNLLLPRNQLSDEQAMALSSDRRFTLDWPNPANGFQFCLRSNGWVGHLPLGEAILVVEPKVPAAQIFAMLELAYKLKSFEILEGETSVEALEDIFERIAHILAKRVLDRSRKGIYRSYVDRSDDLQFVRGRIDIRGNLRSALCGEPRLRCQYQELTADVEDNVILLWALHLASRLGYRVARAKPPG